MGRHPTIHGRLNEIIKQDGHGNYYIQDGLLRKYLQPIPYNDIGEMGQCGAGVGICPPEILPSGFYLLNADRPNPGYGNYVFRDGSVMPYVPQFWYKIGTGSNGLSVNVPDIKGRAWFANTVQANDFGYALHRAFIDGGVEQPGFFVDKYKVSKNALGSGFVCSSLKNGLPLSAATNHNPLTDLTASDGTNAYYKTIDCAHARDGVNGAVNASSIFFVNSRFIQAALALLSIAHGQAAVSTAQCAWYDGAGNINFPKGCNDNTLRDVNDAPVLYIADGYSNCGKTGSGLPFAKTTHNGQECGVADLNGLLWEINLGVTCNGTNFYAAKQATAMKSFTSGNTLATDHWGATGIAALMDQFTPHFLEMNAWTCFGNGANQVLSEALSGAGWLLAGLGMPKDANGFGAGTALFGSDGCYQATVNELCLLSCGAWSSSSVAGISGVYWANARSDSGDYVGWRCACYPG